MTAKHIPPKAPRKRGRPAHEPTPTTRRQVEMMAAFGNSQPQIAAIIGVSEPTLVLHYSAELESGHVKANNAVAANLFKQATKDDPKSVQAAQFWLKCRAGWSEHAPLPMRTPAMGKKAAAEVAAETAAVGTGWSDLLH